MFASLDIPAMTAKVRLLADKRDSDFVNDDEIKTLMQDSFDLLFMELVEANENYFLKQTTLKPVNKNEILFPDDLYKLRAVEKVEGNIEYIVYEKSIEEVSGVDNPLVVGYSTPLPFGYVLFPNSLKIYPEDSSEGVDFRLSYIRDPLTIESDKMQKTWEKFISYKTAYTIGVVEENPKPALGDLALELSHKIKQFASQRNTGVRTIKDLERPTYHGYGSYGL